MHIIYKFSLIVLNVGVSFTMYFFCKLIYETNVYHCLMITRFSSNFFQFVPFSERISSVNVDVIHRIRRIDDEVRFKN